MVRWGDFEEAAPELAALGRERLERFGFVFVGTVRSDGGPRVNPVEAYVVQGHLALNMMWRSLKALDLLRDPRLFVHTPIVDRLGSPGEFKLRGRAIEVDERSRRNVIAAAIEAAIEWRPPEQSHFFTVDVESAAFVTYESDGTQRVKRWRLGRGVD
ncbi:MAG: pyridoxamine 5'-phosphate oxidase family protein [Actinomycetota bacterium]|nr:pyridoxamine 5'-phosphate oxidase family protein [Actinomycetota bacterium]